MRPNLHAVIIDDDKSIVRTLIKTLSQLRFEIRLAIDNAHAIQLIDRFRPALIISEIGKEDVDAIQLVDSISENITNYQYRMIVLTDNLSEELEVKCFNKGIDYYLFKPIKEAVFIKRVERLFKGFLKEESNKTKLLEFGSFFLDPIDKSIFDKKRNKKLSMQHKSFDILYLLVSNPDKIFSREKIRELSWAKSSQVSTRTVDVHILKIRQVIGNEYIKTCKGLGYRFVEGVNTLS